MAQIQGGETFTNVAPGKTVNSARLNNHVGGAVILNGAVIEQAAKAALVAGDTILVGDSAVAADAPPKKVLIENLLLQAQRDGTQRWGGVAGGTANVITLATTPASSGGYATGEVIRFVTGIAANTGAVTINLDGRGAKNLYSSAPAALIAGDLPPNSVVEAVYDGTQWQIVGIGAVNSHLCGEPLRGDTQQYATVTGTNSLSLTLLDSAGIATYTAFYDGMVVRFKTVNANTGAVTLQVGALAAKSLVNRLGLDLPAGALRAGQIVTAVYDLANTRFVVVSPLCSWDYVGIAGATLANGLTDFAHGLGALPTHVRVVLLCTTDQSPWLAASAHELDAANVSHGSGDPEINWWADATNVHVAIADRTNLVATSASGTKTTLTNTSWKLKVYASL